LSLIVTVQVLYINVEDKALLAGPTIPMPKFLYSKVVSNELVSALLSTYIIRQAFGVPNPGSRSTVIAVPAASAVQNLLLTVQLFI
jgi:hypothetical protein